MCKYIIHPFAAFFGNLSKYEDRGFPHLKQHQFPQCPCIAADCS